MNNCELYSLPTHSQHPLAPSGPTCSSYKTANLEILHTDTTNYEHNQHIEDHRLNHKLKISTHVLVWIVSMRMYEYNASLPSSNGKQQTTAYASSRFTSWTIATHDT